MEETYFIYQDLEANNRQSDGVAFCTINQFNDGKIYYYCSEYMTFWDCIEEAGDLSKAKDFGRKITIKPVTLSKICDEGLCEYIDTIKQYKIKGKNIVNMKYIHLK